MGAGDVSSGHSGASCAEAGGASRAQRGETRRVKDSETPGIYTVIG